VSKKLDAANNEIPVPWHDFNELIISKSKPFDCEILVKSAFKLRLIMEQWVEAQKSDYLHATIATDKMLVEFMIIIPNLGDEEDAAKMPCNGVLRY
jgi:hypothetical protein